MRQRVFLNVEHGNIFKCGIFSQIAQIQTFTTIALSFFASFSLYMFSLFFFFSSLGPYLQHMEVPKLEVESELQLLACATAMPDLSHILDLCYSLW